MEQYAGLSGANKKEKAKYGLYILYTFTIAGRR